MNWVWLDEHHTKYRCLSSFAYKPKRTCSQMWECIVPPCDFIDANGCLIESPGATDQVKKSDSEGGSVV